MDCINTPWSQLLLKLSINNCTDSQDPTSTGFPICYQLWPSLTCKFQVQTSKTAENIKGPQKTQMKSVAIYIKSINMFTPHFFITKITDHPCCSKGCCQWRHITICGQESWEVPLVLIAARRNKYLEKQLNHNRKWL